MVYTSPDEFATYEVVAKSPTEVRAAIAPIMRLTGVPFDDGPGTQQQQTGSRGVSVADEIERLAGLHSSGVLTNDEFAVLKAKLMG